MKHTTRAVLLALVLVGGLVAIQPTANALTRPPVITQGVDVHNAPASDFWNSFHYPNPGSPSNPTVVHPVAPNAWYNLQYDGCSQQVRIGTYAGYAYANMRYVSGGCSFGGVALVTSKVPGDIGYPGLSTNPTWNSGTKQVCTIGSNTVDGCIQLGDGSLWDQPPAASQPSPRPLVGANAIICHLDVSDPIGGNSSTCLTVSFGLF